MNVLQILEGTTVPARDTVAEIIARRKAQNAYFDTGNLIRYMLLHYVKGATTTNRVYLNFSLTALPAISVWIVAAFVLFYFVYRYNIRDFKNGKQRAVHKAMYWGFAGSATVLAFIRDLFVTKAGILADKAGDDISRKTLLFRTGMIGKYIAPDEAAQAVLFIRISWVFLIVAFICGLCWLVVCTRNLVKGKYRQDCYMTLGGKWRFPKTDRMLLLFTVILLIVGAAEMFSVGSYKQYIGASSSDFIEGRVNPMATFNRQVVAALLGIVAMIFVSLHKTNWLPRLGYIMYAGMFLALAGTGLYGRLNGQEFARSIFGLQPSEIAKTALIVMLAVVFEEDYYRVNMLPLPAGKNTYICRDALRKRKEEHRAGEENNLGKLLRDCVSLRLKSVGETVDFANPLCSLEKYNIRRFKNPKRDAVAVEIKMLALFAAYAFMVIFGNHISGALLIFLLGMLMVMISDNSGKFKLTCFGITVACGVVIAVIGTFYEPISEFCYGHSAGAGFLSNVWDTAGNIVTKIHERFNADGNEQVRFGLVALGRGGLFGVGYGRSVMKRFYVPVSESDMVFSIFGEEWGLVGCMVLLSVFALVIWRCVEIAKNAERICEKYVCLGVALHIFLQVMLHVIVNSWNWINTGVVLPFISQGGSAMLAQCIEIGLVLGIARNNNLRREQNK